MLRVDGLDVFYGRSQALWGVSFEVQQGEIVVLLGANGAGKSTCLKALSGLLVPTAGSITFEGRAISGLPPNTIVGLGLIQVPEGRRLFPFMTIAENLAMGSYHPAFRSGRAEAVERALNLFPILRERRRQLAGTLSGGEQQMLAIARALAARPRLLMLDEPSLGLAPFVVEEILATIQRVNREGTTILLVEQNTEDALTVAHRGYVLENGRVILEGRAQDLLQNDYVRAAYLGI